MTFDTIRKHLVYYLDRSRMKIDISGFDMDAFTKTVRCELKEQLDSIEYIAFEDDDIMTDAEKIRAIQELFQQDS